MSASAFHSTAVLVFTRTQENEIRNKQLLPSKNTRLEIQTADILLKHTLRTANASGLPVFIETSETQSGDNFGDRLSKALAKTLSRGYENVICIGTDSPDLKKEHLLEAAVQLSQDKPTLGASKDGGVYLLGLQSRNIYDLNFQAINWHSDKVFEQLKNAIADVHELNDIINDIDSFSDLKNYIRSTQKAINHIAKLFIQVLQLLFEQHRLLLSKRIRTVLPLADQSLRAPPIF